MTPPTDAPQDDPTSENENLTSDADGVGVGHSVERRVRSWMSQFWAWWRMRRTRWTRVALREEEAESQGAAPSDAHV